MQSVGDSFVLEIRESHEILLFSPNISGQFELSVSWLSIHSLPGHRRIVLFADGPPAELFYSPIEWLNRNV